MEVELAGSAFAAGMKVSAHLCRAAMGDGPDGSPLCRAHGVTVFTQMGGQEAAQHVNDGSCHDGVAGGCRGLTGEFAAEFFH
jgi:hypothetical protein